MTTALEQRVAFDEVARLLSSVAAVSAHAIRAHPRDAPARAVLEQQLEHTLDRLALLYGRGTYENLNTVAILHTAVGNELRLAGALEGPESAAAARRAQSLVDAARRGVRLHARQPPASVTVYRGVYVEPLRREFERSLWQQEEPYLRWRDGAVVVLPADELDALRSAGDEVDVLFLDPGELLDLDARDDRPALEAELGRRLAAARAAPDRVGDSRDRHVLRMLLRQSTVLRNLRDRLAAGHPSAHAALLPILAEHHALLASRLAAEPPSLAVLQDPLGATIDGERDLQALAGQWAAEPDDPAGLHGRFRAVADAGTHLTELLHHHP